jgi:hypothetical protein
MHACIDAMRLIAIIARVIEALEMDRCVFEAL